MGAAAKVVHLDIRIRARRDASLSPGARLLFLDVCDLADARGYCYATDEYLAGLHSATERTVRNWLNELDAAGYIHRDRDGRRRRVFIGADPAREDADTGKKFPESDFQCGNEFPERIFRPPYIQESPPEGGDARPRTREAGEEQEAEDVPPPPGEPYPEETPPQEPSPAEPPQGAATRSHRITYPNGFTAPTEAEVVSAAAMFGVPEEDARRFWLHYESVGWVKGAHVMRNWKTALRGWHLNEPKFNRGGGGGGSSGYGGSGRGRRDDFPDDFDPLATMPTFGATRNR